jgi:SAM-dependent methyltransferase
MCAEPPSMSAYFVADFSMVEFPPGARVVDVGCGGGHYLRQLTARGYRPYGVEPVQECVDQCRREGYEVCQGWAEELPLADQSCDGVLCNVVLPYCDERRAVAEWARVLIPGGEVRACYHGLGYAIRLIAVGPSVRTRLFGLKMVLNTWYCRCCNRRFPGRLGNTIYQSTRRMRRYYRASGLQLVVATQGKSFLGFPVFIYHHLKKTA